jgi:hypothetical protein
MTWVAQYASWFCARCQHYRDAPPPPIYTAPPVPDASPVGAVSPNAFGGPFGPRGQVPRVAFLLAWLAWILYRSPETSLAFVIAAFGQMAWGVYWNLRLNVGLRVPGQTGAWLVHVRSAGWALTAIAVVLFVARPRDDIPLSIAALGLFVAGLLLSRFPWRGRTRKV